MAEAAHETMSYSEIQGDPAAWGRSGLWHEEGNTLFKG